MRIPWWIKIIVSIFVVVGALGLYKAVRSEPWVLNCLGQFAIILTLAVLIVYTYYTQSHARAEWTPNASLNLVPAQDKPYLFRFVLKNYSKHSLQCRCNLNASISEVPFRVGGFFSGESSFDLQPFGEGACAAMDIRNLLAEQDLELEHIENEATDENHKKQFRFDIDFSYNILDSKDLVQNPRQPWFFDFRRKIWVLDV